MTLPVLREIAASNAAARQETIVDSWTVLAAEYLRGFAGRASGQPFLIEDAVSCAPVSLKPKEPRAWGAAVMFARRHGWLVHARDRDGRRKYAMGRVNCSPKPMWRAWRAPA